MIIKKIKLQQYIKSKRVYCSLECSRKYSSKISSATMTKTNKKYASERMKKNNPMKKAETREKMKVTMKAMGIKPVIQGGNGKVMPVPQKKLSMALGWITEYVVKTKIKIKGIPPCYKIDIAKPDLKIGIEVDGFSHCSIERKKADIRKTTLLTLRGWKILRFSNKEVMENLNSCVQKVLSIT